MKEEPEEITRFNLNIPVSLLRKVQICAKRDNRSVTQEMVVFLKLMTQEIKDESTFITK